MSAAQPEPMKDRGFAHFAEHAREPASTKRQQPEQTAPDAIAPRAFAQLLCKVFCKQASLHRGCKGDQRRYVAVRRVRSIHLVVPCRMAIVDELASRPPIGFGGWVAR